MRDTDAAPLTDTEAAEVGALLLASDLRVHELEGRCRRLHRATMRPGGLAQLDVYLAAEQELREMIAARLDLARAALARLALR